MLNYLLAPLATLFLLAGCHWRLPATATPVLREQLAIEANSEAQPATQPGRWPATSWWHRYQDEELNRLVDRALRVSPDLEAAAARVAMAQQQVQLRAAENGVRGAGTATLQRQRLSDNALLPPRLLGFNWYSPAELGADFSYQPDLWKKQALALRAAGASADAVAADRAARTVALSTEIVQLYFVVRSDAARIELARSTVNSLERARAIAESRLAAELNDRSELQRLQLQLLEARNQLGDLDTEMQLKRIALASLVDLPVAQLPDLPAMPSPEIRTELPEDASLGLVARRADITAARRRVDAAVAGVDVARRGYLPDLKLRALLGLSSRDVDLLLNAGSAAPIFSAALSLPLFDAGATRIRHASEQSKLRLAVAEYHSTLQLATREVNAALQQRASRARQAGLHAEEVAIGEAQRQRAELQLMQGLRDARTLLTAELQLLSLRDHELQTRAQHLQADLALIQALGGGFQ